MEIACYPPISICTGPDFEYQRWGIPVSWVEGGDWKGWCMDSEWLNTAVIGKGPGYTHPSGIMRQPSTHNFR